MDTMFVLTLLTLLRIVLPVAVILLIGSLVERRRSAVH
jgi:hypothetical protein